MDISFAKISTIEYYLMCQQTNKFLEILSEIENENKILKDQFIQFLIDSYYCVYYMGFNSPIVSKEQAENYLNKIEQAYQVIDFKDDWEKYYCTSRYHDLKAWHVWRTNDDLSTAIEFHKMCIEASSKIPEDGVYYSALYHNNLGNYYHWSGYYEEAVLSYNRALDVHEKYDNLHQLIPLTNLSFLNASKGDLQKAIELNMQALDVVKRLNDTFGIFYVLTTKGNYLYQEGNYDETLEAYQESLVYRKQHGEPLKIFMGYFQIFNFYYRRFKTTRDKVFLTHAKQTLADLQELSETHSDNKTVVNYTNYAQALVLKQGSIIKKAKAIITLQELIELYPKNIGISLNLLELLFEDVIQSEDQETIDQIDKLMVKISKIALRNNPQAIFTFISQQVFLAKYNFYIKGDPSLALEILNDAKDHINTYKLDNLANELNAEIKILESELTKWDDVDISVKERIKSSEFSKYIQEALKIANKQT